MLIYVLSVVTTSDLAKLKISLKLFVSTPVKESYIVSTVRQKLVQNN